MGGLQLSPLVSENFLRLLLVNTRTFALCLLFNSTEFLFFFLCQKLGLAGCIFLACYADV